MTFYVLRLLGKIPCHTDHIYDFGGNISGRQAINMGFTTTNIKKNPTSTREDSGDAAGSWCVVRMRATRKIKKKNEVMRHLSVDAKLSWLLHQRPDTRPTRYPRRIASRVKPKVKEDTTTTAILALSQSFRRTKRGS